jgi:hypothetical protein
MNIENKPKVILIIAHCKGGDQIAIMEALAKINVPIVIVGDVPQAISEVNRLKELRTSMERDMILMRPIPKLPETRKERRQKTRKKKRR